MKLAAQGITREYIRKGSGTNIFRAVEKTDFELPEGQVTEIIGRSGSGKTTFINMLAGLLEPTEGKVILGEYDLYSMDDSSRSRVRNSSIGIIPQGQTGLQSLTVLENVTSPSLMYGGSGNKDRAMQLLDAMGIADLSDVYSNELSGGELRRMSIARALINEPEIIIADEPTGDLDDETTAMVLQLLRGCADKGGSVLLVTHEKDAEMYADNVWRMESGVLKQRVL